ncbi:MAG: ribonuclease P protein component [Kaiparowitsia implicata GSE-PSE-MK54-09C]|nr:ribonuclease P protein component [Kaiparowitsia implicata GSE-PSE-MK54-09C]
MTLPKNHRLTHRDEFALVYRRGRRHKGARLTLRAFRVKPTSPDLAPVAPTRVGISISQKVSKRAVVRNRIKRQIRAIVRSLLPYISPGWLVVVVVHPTAVECDYAEFLQELKQLLTDAEVCHGHSGRCVL